MTWFFTDPATGNTFGLTAQDFGDEISDFVWLNMRKMGSRWYVLDNFNDGGTWLVDVYEPSGYRYTYGLPVPAGSVGWRPSGMTTTKHHLVVSDRQSGANADRLLTYALPAGASLNLELVRVITISDAVTSIRENLQVTFLEHHFYVTARLVSAGFWGIKKYDENGQLLGFFTLPSITVGTEFLAGITTDGKNLYLCVTAATYMKIMQVDTNGAIVNTYQIFSGALTAQEGITFNGRYLITRFLG